MTIKFFCELCEDGQSVEIEPLVTDELNPDVAWGDIVCKVCHFVIATASTDLDKQGQYEFVRTDCGHFHNSQNVCSEATKDDIQNRCILLC